MKHMRLALAALGLPLLLAMAFAGTAGAATTTLTFEEIEKGSTFGFVDNAPKSELRHGFPTTISAGDLAVGTSPLVEGAKRIGKLETSCVATKTAKSFDAAGFMCEGTFIFGKGTLVASAVITGEKQTEGAITGGTGIYAGAHGTFLTKEGGARSKVTVTLFE